MEPNPYRATPTSGSDETRPRDELAAPRDELASSRDPSTSVRPTRVRWLIFALSGTMSWLLYLHRYTWNFISTELADTYQLTPQETQNLFSVFNFTYGFLQVPGGMALDFFGPHLFLGAVVILWSLVMPWFLATGNLAILTSLRLAFGAAQSATYPGLSKVTQTWFPPRSRSTVQGWISAFFGRAGGAMSQIVLATVLMGWLQLSGYVSLWVMAAFGIGFGILWLLLFRNDPRHDPRVNDAERALIAEGRSLRTTETEAKAAPRDVLPWSVALKNRSLRFFVVQQFMSAGADTVYNSLMGFYFLDRGIKLASSGLYASLPLWGGAIGGLTAGFVTDYLIRRTESPRWVRSGIGSSGQMLAAILIISVVTNTDTAAAAAWALFVVKFFGDWSQPTVWGAVTDLGGRYSATVFGIINTAGTIGGIFAPLVFGYVLEQNSIYTTVDGATVRTTNYNPMFFTLGVMYFFSALAWLGLDCSRRMDPEG